MAEPALKIYEIEYNNKIYEVEAPEGAPEEELFSVIEEYNPEPEAVTPSEPVAVPTKPQAPASPVEEELAPNAMLGADQDQVVATRTLAEIPGARERLESLFRKQNPNGGWKYSYEQARDVFAQEYPDVPFASGDNTPARWSQLRQYASTPEGRQKYSQQGFFGPINRQTGIADPAAPDSMLEELGTSAVRATHNIANTYRGAAAVGADLVGADETSEAWLEDYLEQQAAIQQNLPTSAGQITQGEVDSLGDLGVWSASVVGELAPELATSLTTGLVGGLIGKKIAKQAADKYIEKQVAEGVTQEVAEREAVNILQKGIVRGGASGAAAQSVVQETGATFGDTYGKTGERKPLASLAAGTASGLLDALMPTRILSKVGGPVAERALKESLVKKFGKEGVTTLTLEGVTEGVQSVITQLPAGKPIDWDEVAESIARGGFGGLVAGGSTGVYEGVRQNKAAATLPPVRPEPTITAPTATGRRTKAFREEIETTRQQVDTRVKSIVSDWENAPEVETHQNFNKLRGVHNDAVGVMDSSGKVHINTEALLREANKRGVTPDDMVQALTFHEGLGHFGLKEKFGAELDTQLALMLGNSPVYQKRVQKWMEKNPDSYAGDPNRDIRAFEELLAERSEKIGSKKLPAGIFNQLANTVKNYGRKIGVNFEYSTREVETILGMAHTAVIDGKGRDVIGNGFRATPRYMYAGKNAENANIKALAFAKDLVDSGLDPEEVRQGTGWFKADDGHWRFEIDDSTSHFYEFQGEKLIDLLGDGTLESLPINEVFNHPELFEAYPELADTYVWGKAAEDDDPRFATVAGSYDPDSGTMYVNPRLSDKEAKATILHELQHAVQAIEGFAQGSNEDSAMQTIPDNLLVKGAKNYLKWIKTDKARDLYGDRVEPVTAYIKGLLSVDDTRNLRQFFSQEPGARKSAYMHSFGEFEARDVEDRMDMSAEDRRTVAPHLPEAGIDPEDFIFESVGPSNKYMMLTSPDKVELTPEEIEAMPAEDIFEAENAMVILERMTEGYTPVVMSMDDIKAEADARGFTPSELMKSSATEPGELAKKLFMYDIAFTKLHDRVAELYEKMQNGTATANDRAAHAKALFTMQEVTDKIFGLQGELGRALNAVKHVNFTRRGVKGAMETVAQFKKGSPFEVLNDPDEYFRYAQTIQQQFNEAKEKAKENGGRIVANAVNLPRALMATADLSAPLRQGLFLIHKLAWWKSFANMFRYWGSEKAWQDLMEDITTRETYGAMLQANLALSNIDGKPTQREEDFQTEWAQKIPGFGKLVRMSERAYAGFLNKLRADVFDQLVAKLPEGSTTKDLKDIGRFINAATGRGNLPKGMQGAAPLLNGIFFSPRLIASRVVMTTALVDPRTYVSMNKTARNEYIKSVLTVGSLAFLVLSLAAMGGAEVEKDPRSTDFAKIKVGNTRYDILGGEGQYITLAARVLKNSTKTADGQIRPYGNEFGQSTRKDAVFKFFENKAAPIPSFVLDYLRGTDAIGRPFEMDRAIVTRFIPMFAQDVYENVQEEGAAKGIAMGVPAAFGVGVQNYKSYSLDTERELEAPVTFNMKEAMDGEYPNARVEDGVVILDDKAQLEWKNRLNFYYKEWMKDEVADPSWKTLSSEEKREIIKQVRNDARKEAKADMLEVLQLEEEQQ